MDDTQAMERCLVLAREALERGDHSVGSVVLRNGEIIGEGNNRQVTDLDFSSHAEVAAIRNACRALGQLDLSECWIYSSSEPCWLCSTAIRRSGISRVVFGRRSPTGGYSSIFPILTDATYPQFGPPPEVVPGFLADRAELLYTDGGRQPGLPTSPEPER